MQEFRYYAPTEVVFGKGVEAKTGEVAKKYGRKALLVFGQNSVKKNPFLQTRMFRSLKKGIFLI